LAFPIVRSSHAATSSTITIRSSNPQGFRRLTENRFRTIDEANGGTHLWGKFANPIRTALDRTFCSLSHSGVVHIRGKFRPRSRHLLVEHPKVKPAERTGNRLALKAGSADWDNLQGSPSAKENEQNSVFTTADDSLPSRGP